MRISDWSSDVCSSDLIDWLRREEGDFAGQRTAGKVVTKRMRQILAGIADGQLGRTRDRADRVLDLDVEPVGGERQARDQPLRRNHRPDRPSRRAFGFQIFVTADRRSEEHTSELQSLMRISYA